LAANNLNFENIKIWFLFFNFAGKDFLYINFYSKIKIELKNEEHPNSSFPQKYAKESFYGTSS
jgi:hypothetical protein